MPGTWSNCALLYSQILPLTGTDSSVQPERRGAVAQTVASELQNQLLESSAGRSSFARWASLQFLMYMHRGVEGGRGTLKM